MATQNLTIRAIMEDAATEGLTRLESAVTRVGSKMSALNTISGDGAGGFGGMVTKLKGHVTDLTNRMHTLSDKLDVVTHKLGAGFEMASKRAIIGIVGIGAAVGAMAINIQKEVDTATVTLTTFLGGNTPANQKTAASMINQMGKSTWLAPLQTQVDAVKQVMIQPAYKSQAMAINEAALTVAAGSGTQSAATYSALMSTIGRITQMGTVQGRAGMMLSRAGIDTTQLAAQMGIDLTNPATNNTGAARAFRQLMTKTVTPQQIINLIEQQAAGKFAGAPNQYANTISGAVAMGKTDVTEQLRTVMSQSGLGASIHQLIGPVSDLVGSFTRVLMPPLVNILTALVKLANQLTPVIAPIAQLLGDVLAKAFTAMGPVMKPLADAFHKMLPAMETAFSTLIPLLPTFLMLGVQLLALLPNTIILLNPFLRLLVDILNPLTKFLTVLVANPTGAVILSTLLATLLGFLALEKLVTMFQKLYGWMKGLAALDAASSVEKLAAGCGCGPGGLAGSKVPAPVGPVSKVENLAKNPAADVGAWGAFRAFLRSPVDVADLGLVDTVPPAVAAVLGVAAATKLIGMAGKSSHPLLGGSPQNSKTWQALTALDALTNTGVPVVGTRSGAPGFTGPLPDGTWGASIPASMMSRAQADASAATAAAAGGAGPHSGLYVVHVHGDVVIPQPPLTDPHVVKKAFADVAAEGARRGARQPTVNGNQGKAARIGANRPTS